MFLFPSRKKIGPPRKTSHNAVDILLGYRLKDDAAKLIFQKSNPGSGAYAMLTPELRRNYKLALRRKSTTEITHALHCIMGKKQ